MLPADFVSKMAPERRDELIRMGRCVRYGKNRLIFQAGRDDPSVYLLLEGRVKVFRGEDRHESILWFCGEGDVFGLAEAFRGNVREVSARAVTETLLSVIDARSFVSFVLEHKDTGRLVLEVLSGRVRVLQEAVIDNIVSTATARVIKVLCALARRYGQAAVGGGVCINIRLTHREISQLSGVSRQTVTSILSELKRRQLIVSEGRRLCLNDLGLVEHLSVKSL